MHYKAQVSNTIRAKILKSFLYYAQIIELSSSLGISNAVYVENNDSHNSSAMSAVAEVVVVPSCSCEACVQYHTSASSTCHLRQYSHLKHQWTCCNKNKRKKQAVAIGDSTCY
jgi:hypothetical protein